MVNFYFLGHTNDRMLYSVIIIDRRIILLQYLQNAIL